MVHLILTLPRLMPWIAQLSSLRGHSVENVNVGSGQTPIIRFLEEPETNDWNKIRILIRR